MAQTFDRYNPSIANYSESHYNSEEDSTPRQNHTDNNSNYYQCLRDKDRNFGKLNRNSDIGNNYQNNSGDLYQYLSPSHCKEFWQSAIDADIVALNFRSADEDELLDCLLYSDKITGWESGSILRQYRNLKEGGWVCESLDPNTQWKTPMDFCCVKPNQPRSFTEEYKGFGPAPKTKIIKYENPPKAEVRVFYLRVNYRISRIIAQKAGFLAEWEVRFPTAPDPNAEDAGFWSWIQAISKLEIILCEGVKKAASLLSAGYCAIAVLGVWMGCKKDDQGRSYLHPDIAPLASYERPVSICFDNDKKPKTRANVWAAQKRLCHCIRSQQQVNKPRGRSLRGQVCIINLPGEDKGVDDVIFNQGVQAFDCAFKERVQFEVERVLRSCRLTQPPDLVLNQRYLGDLPALSTETWVAIKSEKGTGKTESLVGHVAEALAVGKPVILITHRVQLGEALANRLGVPFLSSLGNQGQIQGLGLCVDSMHPNSRAQFNGDQWRDAIVIIDEVDQVIDHLLNADTEVKKHRPEILIEFSKLLAGVLAPDSEGQLITLDADLGNTSINFIHILSGHPECRPYLVLNLYRNPSHQFAVSYENDTPNLLVEKAIQVVESGGKVYFCTSGQKTGSAFGAINLELRFRRRFPERRVLRVDSVTISDPSHPAFKGASKINHLVQNYDIVIVSPTLETGVSVDVTGHFSAVFGIFSGITPANSARQALARVREDLPIHFWAAEKAPSIFQVGNGSKSAQGLIRSQAKEAELNLRRWKEFTLVQDEGNAIVNGAPLETWARIGATRNLELACYREYIKYGLKAEGYVIERSAEDTDKDLRDLTKSIKAESQICFCQRVAESRPFNSETDYQKSKERETKTEQERQRELRHEIQKKLLVEPTPEIVAKTQEPGWIRQIETFYYLTKGRQFVQGRDEARGQATVQDGCAFIPDLNRSQLGNRVEVLEILGVKSLLNRVLGGEEIKKDDPLIIAIHGKVIANHRDLQLIGVNVPTKYPIACVNALLTLLGLKLDKIGRNKYKLRFEATITDAKTGQVKQQKFALNDGRLEIFEQWFKRDASHSAKISEGQSSKRSESIIEKRSSVLEGLKVAAQISRIYIRANLCKKICALAETVWPTSDKLPRVEADPDNPSTLPSHSSNSPPSPTIGATRVRLTETIRDPFVTYPAGTWGKILAVRDGLVEVLLDGFQCPIKIFPDDFETLPAA